MFNKISSAMSYFLESTYLGIGLKKLFTNISNFTYHIVLAAKHLIVGIVSAALILAKSIIGCAIVVLTVNITAFTGSAILLYFSLKSSFSALKDGVFACGKSIFAAVKSLAGFQDPIDEVLNVGEQLELVTSKEFIKAKIDESMDNFFKGFDKVFGIEEEHRKMEPESNRNVHAYEQDIKNGLFTMYEEAKKIYSLLFMTLPQQQQLNGPQQIFTSKVTIEML